MNPMTFFLVSLGGAVAVGFLRSVSLGTARRRTDRRVRADRSRRIDGCGDASLSQPRTVGQLS